MSMRGKLHTITSIQKCGKSSFQPSLTKASEQSDRFADGWKKQSENSEKSLYSDCVLTVKTVPSMVHFRSYKSVVLGCNGNDIGEAFRRYPVREECIIPS